ncbi:helix-turn-helix domain-containing protein [Streptomyces sp. NPDC001089]
MQYVEREWAGEDGYLPEVQERRKPLKGMLSRTDEELGDLFRRGLELMLDEDDYVLTPTYGDDRMRVVLMLDKRLVTLTSPMSDQALTAVATDENLTHAARLVWVHLRNVQMPQRQIGLARALGMDKSTVARSLTALAQRGLVSKADGFWMAVTPETDR